VPGIRDSDPGPGTANYSGTFTSVFSSAKIDPSDDTWLYAVGRDQGVLRFKWNIDTYEYDGTIYDDNQAYSILDYFNVPWEGVTTANATSPVISGVYQQPYELIVSSGSMEFTCVEMSVQNPNVLYVGFTNYLQSRDPDVFRNGYLKLSNIRNSEYLASSTRVVYLEGSKPPDPTYESNTNIKIVATDPVLLTGWKSVGANGIIYFDTAGGIILSMAVDPNTSTTIWRGKSDGISRSTDGGVNFVSVPGTYSNVKDIFIDPINTVNVYIGTELGLFRTRDAGSSWKQIKSGLEGHTTINALGLTPGGVGTRRIFCGTTNGIFMGRTTLDLE
jgi:hypothetical protein